MGEPNQDITAILRAHRRGEAGAFENVVTLVFVELHRIARSQLRRLRPGQTLDTTGLVHESYLKLIGHSRIDWQDRAHFYAIAARAMRQILVDYAKRRSRSKRGHGLPNLDLERREIAVADRSERLLAVSEALDRLSSIDDRLVQIVDCRVFAGYSERETAAALSISLRTAQRDWRRAKSWLKEHLHQA